MSGASSDKSRGLYGKYHVQRVDGKTLGECIVLEFKDPKARVGIKAWSAEMRKDGFEAVADDVDNMLAKFDSVGVVQSITIEVKEDEPVNLMPMPELNKVEE